MKLSTQKNMIFGTGVGETDLTPDVVLVREVYAESTDLNKQMLLFSGEISEKFVEDDYSQQIDLYIRPGYFYFGDREFYAFNEKITQVSHLSSGEVGLYIDLAEIPDGPAPLQAPLLRGEWWKHETNGGASPILVKYFPSGTLESIGIPMGRALSSIEGYSGELGFRLDGEGRVISGEPGDYPDFFTPLSRFAKCHEDWREGSVLPPDRYTYDPYRNRILIQSGEPDGEYVIEFEGRNESFRIDRDLSALVSYPEDSILCLSPDEEIASGEPGEIKLYLERVPSHDITTVTAEVFSTEGNRMEGQAIDMYLVRKDMVSYPDVTPEPLEDGGPFVYSGEFCIDSFTLPLAIVRERHIRVSDMNRIGGKYYTHGIGYLSREGSPDGYLNQGVTDENGIFQVEYHRPPVMKCLDVSVKAVAGSVSAESDILLFAPSGDLIYADDPLDNIVYEMVEPYASGETCDFVIPADCVTPSSIGILPVSEFLDDVYTGARSEFLYPESITDRGSVVTVGYEIEHSGEPFMMKYHAWLNTTILDGRDQYE